MRSFTDIFQRFYPEFKLLLSLLKISRTHSSNNTLFFSLFKPSGFSSSLFSFNNVILFLKSQISLNKCDFNAAYLLSTFFSYDLISSELCLGVAAVFNIGVVVPPLLEL